jgi:hypothetical protein
MNMTPDPRPVNTAVKRRQTSSQSKMVEVTKMQGKEIVSNMQKLSDMEERKVVAAAEIAKKHLQYYKLRDSEIATTQRGLVQAVNGLSQAIVHAYTFRSPYVPRQQSPPLDPAYGGMAAGTVHRSPLGKPTPLSVPTTGAWEAPNPDDDVDMTGSANCFDGQPRDGPRHCTVPAELSDGPVNIAGDDLN